MKALLRHRPDQGNLRSITSMLVAVMFFACMDAVLKALSPHYPPLQIACMRGITALPLVLAYVHWRGAWHKLRGLRWSLHLLRGALGVSMLVMFTLGVRQLPLSAAYTIFFIAPLLITMLSVPVLKERVPRAHWWAIGFGFIGVVVALRPSGSDLQSGLATMGGLSLVLAALCYAVTAIAGRLLSRTDSLESLILTMMVFIAVGSGILAAPGWVPVSASHAWLLVALGITGFVGQLAINDAFRHGQASAVAPFEYTALAWAVGLDWLVWQTLPGMHTWIGAVIIIGSGLYIVRHEQRISQVHASAEHP